MRNFLLALSIIGVCPLLSLLVPAFGQDDIAEAFNRPGVMSPEQHRQMLLDAGSEKKTANVAKSITYGPGDEVIGLLLLHNTGHPFIPGERIKVSFFALKDSVTPVYIRVRLATPGYSGHHDVDGTVRHLGLDGHFGSKPKMVDRGDLFTVFEEDVPNDAKSGEYSLDILVDDVNGAFRQQEFTYWEVTSEGPFSFRVPYISGASILPGHIRLEGKFPRYGVFTAALVAHQFTGLSTETLADCVTNLCQIGLLYQVGRPTTIDVILHADGFRTSATARITLPANWPLAVPPLPSVSPNN